MEQLKIQKNDFLEIEYTGKLKSGEVYDSNKKEDLEKINPKAEAKPLIICIGQNMILPSIDDFLIDKETGKFYTLELTPEKAFGTRKKELIKIMPVSVFRNQIPQSGMIFSFDNLLGRISTVSGGRVIVDFNNPLAGKDVIYNIKVIKKITDDKEKIKSLMLAYFKQEFEFEIKDKKLIIKTDEKLIPIMELFKAKFKEVLNLELEVEKK